MDSPISLFFQRSTKQKHFLPALTLGKLCSIWAQSLRKDDCLREGGDMKKFFVSLSLTIHGF